MAWSGLSELELLEFERTLCRVKNRRLMFGGKDSAVVAGAPVTMAGSFALSAIAVVNRLISRRADTDKLNKDKVASAIGVTKSDFSSFLHGNLSKKKNSRADWEIKADYALRWLMTGSTDTIPGSNPVAQRIERYFFRNSGQSRYFEKLRASSAQAWTDRELAGEVRWLAPIASIPAGRAWLVTSDCAYDDGDFADVCKALVAAAVGGVLICFVRPVRDGVAHESLERLKNALSSTSSDARFMEIVADDGPHSYFVPETRYLYLDGYRIPDGTGESNKAPEAEASLWIIRPPRDIGRDGDDGDHVEDMPLACQGHAPERKAFQEWIGKLGCADGVTGQPVPAPDPTPTPRDGYRTTIPESSRPRTIQPEDKEQA